MSLERRSQDLSRVKEFMQQQVREGHFDDAQGKLELDVSLLLMSNTTDAGFYVRRIREYVREGVEHVILVAYSAANLRTADVVVANASLIPGIHEVGRWKAPEIPTHNATVLKPRGIYHFKYQRPSVRG